MSDNYKISVLVYPTVVEADRRHMTLPFEVHVTDCDNDLFLSLTIIAKRDGGWEAKGKFFPAGEVVDRYFPYTVTLTDRKGQEISTTVDIEELERWLRPT